MSDPRYAIAAGRFYQDVAERLVAGAREVLEAGGAEGIDVLDVPGAFELPLAASYAAESGRYAEARACYDAALAVDAGFLPACSALRDLPAEAPR